MEKSVVSIILLLSFFGLSFNEMHGPISFDPLLVDELWIQFFYLEDKIWMDAVTVILKQPFKSPEPSLKKAFNEILKFDQQIQKMPQDNILVALDNIKISNLSVVYDKLAYIHGVYTNFKQHHINKNVLQIEDVWEGLFHLIMNSRGILDNIIDLIKYSNFKCKNYNNTPEQIVYQLYNAVALAHLKVYIMIQFSAIVHQITFVVTSPGYWMAIEKRKKFQQNAEKLRDRFQNAMMKTGRLTYRCDPVQHVEDKTYAQFTKLLQGYIQDEASVNPDGTCRYTCDNDELNQNECYPSRSEYCRKNKKCNGYVVGCKNVQSHMSTVCISPSNSTRRYEYVQFNTRKLFGKESYCETSNKVDSWTKSFDQCPTCVCLCDEQSDYSDRFVNLRAVTANINENMVVTGLRFVKANRIMHLQIQEGQLLPYGYINASTVRWVPVDNYNINDPGVLVGEDFHVMTNDQRSMLIDIIGSQVAEHIITGIKFERIDGILALQATGKMFNFTTGKLVGNNVDVYVPQNVSSVKRLVLDENDIPTKTSASEVLPIPSVLEFTHTGFDFDAAQSTIPFFDTQPVFCDPPVPLHAVGIVYKKHSNYGGFVVPALMNYAFRQHMFQEFPTMDRALEKIDQNLIF